MKTILSADGAETVVPQVGDVVHYVSYGTPGGEFTRECRAAVVTAVGDLAVDPVTLQPVDSRIVDLCVLNPTGQFFNQDVVQDETHGNGGRWHYRYRCTQ